MSRMSSIKSRYGGPGKRTSASGSLCAEVGISSGGCRWGNPKTNLSSGQFGRITNQAGDRRIMQFAVQYGF